MRFDLCTHPRNPWPISERGTSAAASVLPCSVQRAGFCPTRHPVRLGTRARCGAHRAVPACVGILVAIRAACVCSRSSCGVVLAAVSLVSISSELPSGASALRAASTDTCRSAPERRACVCLVCCPRYLSVSFAVCAVCCRARLLVVACRAGPPPHVTVLSVLGTGAATLQRARRSERAAEERTAERRRRRRAGARRGRGGRRARLVAVGVPSHLQSAGAKATIW